jgi:hemerythrin-like domain-containing protein
VTEPLDTRTGLPDALAYLRADYPRPGWRGHPRFGQLADFWLAVHDSLRGQGRQLGELIAAFREGQRDEAGFRAMFVPRLNQFLQQLNHHHQIEDHAYFPKFRALDPRMVAGFDLLEADHHVIHGALIETAKGGQALLDALARDKDAARRAADSYATAADRLLALLRQHLADEEELVMPAMLHHGERAVG